MAQVIVCHLPDDVVARLEARAAREGHTLERELRNILIDASRPSRADLIAEVDRIRAMTPRRLESDSTELIREDRDRR